MLSFNKRINGSTYNVRVALSYVAIVALALVISLLPDDSTLGIIGLVGFILAALYWQLFLISQMRQRANDIGSHPVLITALAWCTPFFLVLGFIPGQKQSNRYGPVPKVKTKPY